MDYINLNFQKVIEKMAAERGLSVAGEKGKDIEGTMRFKGSGMCEVEIDVWINETWRKKISCCNENTFEAEVAKVLDKCAVRVDKSLYRDIAACTLDGDVFECEIGDVDVAVRHAGYGTFMESGDYGNNFDPYMYMEQYDRLREQREAADQSRRFTESVLRKAV